MRKTMKTLKEVKTVLEALKPILFEKYKVKKIGIFGSFVKNKQKIGSDLDILVEFEETPTLIEFIELENFLTEKLKIKVDLVMKSSLKKYLGENILKEVIYL